MCCFYLLFQFWIFHTIYIPFSLLFFFLFLENFFFIFFYFSWLYFALFFVRPPSFLLAINGAIVYSFTTSASTPTLSLRSLLTTIMTYISFSHSLKSFLNQFFFHLISFHLLILFLLYLFSPNIFIIPFPTFISLWDSVLLIFLTFSLARLLCFLGFRITLLP